ncbi:hypothetical protein B0H13DRAFT_1867679 [Mycena leptocephala]|nr:hypothetical protein B0H13DRAFT_1867679 [Mycena leptocephala]
MNSSSRSITRAASYDLRAFSATPSGCQIKMRRKLQNCPHNYYKYLVREIRETLRPGTPPVQRVYHHDHIEAAVGHHVLAVTMAQVNLLQPAEVVLPIQKILAAGAGAAAQALLRGWCPEDPRRCSISLTHMYWTYIIAVDLCHLLIYPFHWALQQPTSPQDEVSPPSFAGVPAYADGASFPRDTRLGSWSADVGEDHGLWAARRGASVNYIAHQRDGQRRRRGAARSYAAAPTKVAAVANVQRECQAMVYRAPLVDLAKLTEKEVVQSRDGEFRVCLEGQHWHGVRSQLQDRHSSLAPFKKVLHILRIHNAASPGSSDLPASPPHRSAGLGRIRRRRDDIVEECPADRGPINKTLSDLRTNSNSCRKGTAVPSACSSDELSARSSWSIDMTSNCRCDCAETSRAREQGERRKRCGDRAVDCAADERSGAALELLNFFFLTDRTYLGAPDAPLPGIDTSSPQMTNRGYAAVFSDVNYILFTVVSSPGTKKQKRRVSSELLRDAASNAASRPMLSRSTCLAAGPDSKDCISQGRRGVGRNSTLGLRAGDWKRTVGLKGYDRMACPPDGLHQTGSGEEQRSAISSPLQTRPQAKARNPQHGETRNRQRSRSANIYALGVAWRDPLGGARIFRRVRRYAPRHRRVTR